MVNFLIYPKCSTCRNAKKWLIENEVAFTERHIVEKPLTVAEIREIHESSGLPIKKFFNTSGMKYRELGLKDQMAHLSDEEGYQLLASDGMLVKRPLAYDGSKVTLGFVEATYETVWKD